jgi:HlyD family secretion protein
MTNTMASRSLIPLALALCTACGNGKPAPKASPPPDVATVAARSGTIAPSLELAGVIAPYRQIAIAADLTEPLSEVDVVEGDQVRAGQVLARQLVNDLQSQLTSSERTVAEDQARLGQTLYQNTATTSQNENSAKSARDSLKQAQVNLAGAETDLRRYASLVGSGYIPAQTVDQQRVTVEADRQAVAAARASYDAALVNNSSNGNGFNAGAQQQEIAAARAAVDAAQATADQLKEEIARAVITAPVSGVVDSVTRTPANIRRGGSCLRSSRTIEFTRYCPHRRHKSFP